MKSKIPKYFTIIHAMKYVSIKYVVQRDNGTEGPKL